MSKVWEAVILSSLERLSDSEIIAKRRAGRYETFLLHIKQSYCKAGIAMGVEKNQLTIGSKAGDNDKVHNLLEIQMRNLLLLTRVINPSVINWNL